MALDSSPSLDDFKDGMPSKLPDQKNKRRRSLILIVVLILIAFALGVVNFLQSDTADIMAGKGSLRGRVVDENGDPVAAQIYILGTDLRGQADDSGQFTVEDIPSGERSLAVAFQGSGFEIPVFVQTGTTADLGEVKFTSTLEPVDE
jgi:hypothetical protein